MSGTYFTILAVLVVAGFRIGSGRARAVRSSGTLHSLPAYHGFFIAAAVLTAMMAIYVVGAPLASHYVVSQGLGAFDPAAVSEQLQRDAALRDIQSVIAGNYQGEASEQLRNAAAAYSS